MGDFQQIYDLFTPMLSDGLTFLQTIAVSVAGVMVIWYKIREITSEVQQDQMFSQKAKMVLVALAFVFLVPTIITVIQGYLQ